MKGYNKEKNLSFDVYIDGIDDIMFVKSIILELLENSHLGGKYFDGDITLEFYNSDDLKHFYEWIDEISLGIKNDPLYFSDWYLNYMPQIKRKRHYKREGTIKYYNAKKQCVTVINLHGIIISEINSDEYKVVLKSDYIFIQVNP